jgi:hypothetical protein
VLDQVVQQRRLAHARLPAHHQRPALTSTHSVEEPVQQVAFAAPAPQLRGGLPLAERSASVRDRHYAASTTPRHAPPLGARCSAISIEASMDNQSSLNPTNQAVKQTLW